MLRLVVPLNIIFGLVWIACSSDFSNPPAEQPTNVVTIIGPDYRSRGNVTFESLEGRLASSSGCEVTYTYYQPKEVSNEVAVMIGHGFMRSKKRMAYLAQHLASWGLTVVNLEFPVDGKCSFVCGKGEKRFSRDVIQQTIVGLTTAFLLWQAGIDANGETWWSDRQPNYKTLRNAGYIDKPIINGTELNQ